MLATIEKVITLKRVSIFSRTSDEILAEIGSILREQSFAAGEMIVRKGDPGDRLYIIIAGQVVVHDGERVIATFNERDIFGELSVLDAEPRSASVTAVTDTDLFYLEQDALYELMAARVEILQGIMNVLCQRIRQQNVKLVEGGQ